MKIKSFIIGCLMGFLGGFGAVSLIPEAYYNAAYWVVIIMVVLGILVSLMISTPK